MGTGTTTVSFKLKGLALGLLMHNRQLANPRGHYAKELAKVSGKRSKTEDDHAAMSDLEMEGGLYWSKELGPYVPAEWIESMLRDAAKKSRQGKAIQSAVFCTDVGFPLQYRGPRDMKGLLADESFRDVRPVNVMSKKIMRTRPYFANWSLTGSVEVDTTIVDLDALASYFNLGGRVVGLGDYRPKFGRFLVESLTEEV